MVVTQALLTSWFLEIHYNENFPSMPEMSTRNKTNNIVIKSRHTLKVFMRGK